MLDEEQQRQFDYLKRLAEEFPEGELRDHLLEIHAKVVEEAIRESQVN